MEQTQLDQVNRAIARGRQDIVFFAWYFLGIKLHPGQIRFLRGADGIVNVLVPGNRFGKTVLIAVRHIWHNFYKIGQPAGEEKDWAKSPYRTAALAPHTEILETDFQIIKSIMTSSFVISMPGEPTRTNVCKIGWFIVLESCRNSAPFFIQFRNNCGIQFFSGGEDQFKSVQGKLFGYGSYDEGGRSHHLAYELKSNLGPRFSEMAAPLDIVSTPDMRSPSLLYHYEIFEKGIKGEEGFRSFEGSAYENVYLPKHYFEREEMRLAGDPVRDQVLFGKFVFSGDSIFPGPDILEATNPGLNPGKGYEPGHKYWIGVDTAIGGDEFSITVLKEPVEGCADCTDKFETVRQLSVKGSSKSPDIHLADLIGIVEAYRQNNNVKMCLETWNGESVAFYKMMPVWLQTLTTTWGSFTPAHVVRPPKGSRGAKKAEIIVALRKLLNQKRLAIPNESTLVKQLSIYREDDKNIPTDRVISLALAVWLATDGKPKTDTFKLIEVDF